MFFSDTYGNRHAAAYTNRHVYTDPDSYSHAYCNGNAYRDSNAYTYGNGGAYRDSNANTYTDADPMHGEMFTHTKAVSDFGWATHAAPSFNTAACRFIERDPSAATHSAASSNAAADAYRFAASYSRAAPLTHMMPRSAFTMMLAT